ncbi:Dienelactone hydrolase [Nannocystis exedens]|uniref:Dienelactone hydrolase n=2 Tax=Nannocystis exedens TaxID=54 RepID=A0A1I1YQY7_9BACT|nr:Alpha/beta hydrolase family protein [Nannocystis exedens]SFE22025.1 Dienelactone hydrolase [Nannocystis exedens]
MLNTHAYLVTFTAALVWLSLPADARADTYGNITVPGPTAGVTLDGRIYVPDPLPANPPAVIMMHGCSGMWYNDNPANGASREIERWGRELAAQGYVAIAVDSYEGRRPTSMTYLQYQNQCYMGDPARVNPYTTRVADIGAALDYLIEEFDVDTGAIGLLGWSQGAQAVLVAMAATSRDSSTPYTTDPPYAAAVAFYPGCGSALGFGYNDHTDGWWRPANPLRLNMGTEDDFEDDCQARVTTAHDTYGTTPGSADELLWVQLPGAGHTFDEACYMQDCGPVFPTVECIQDEWDNVTMKNQCAMREADIDSLDFLLARVVG